MEGLQRGYSYSAMKYLATYDRYAAKALCYTKMVHNCGTLDSFDAGSGNPDEYACHAVQAHIAFTIPYIAEWQDNFACVDTAWDYRSFNDERIVQCVPTTRFTNSELHSRLTLHPSVTLYKPIVTYIHVQVWYCA